MIAPEAAWGIVRGQVRPLESVTLPLTKALRCCLAEDIRADRDLPPADRSAMDGYAVYSHDLRKRPCVLRVLGEVAAGSPRCPRVRAGTCVRIFTGANVPPGADAVVMVEQTEERDGMVTIRSSALAGSNILRRGEDARQGSVLLPRGTWVGAAEVGVCAAVGKGSVAVHRRPRVAILCTGSELRSTRGRVGPHEIRNSNGPALSAALAQWGITGVRFQRVADRPEILLAALRSALRDCEVVMFTGGVSAGARDFVQSAVEAAGARIRFHGVAMKPGKPILYATAPEGRHVFGLPGNPLATLTAFHEFALPAVRRLAGYSVEACRPVWWVPLAKAADSKAGRMRYELARLVSGRGGLTVVGVPSHSSADLASAGRADGVILLPPPRRRFTAGELVMFRPWRPLP
jgi:molybdopterin molybdotransferase